MAEINSNDVEVSIVGAGPAGLFCAYTLASRGIRVRVYEKTGKAGVKLLVSGSGKCNVSNTAPLDRFFRSYGDKGNFVKPALLSFPPSALITFFEERGLPLTEVNDGKLFPSTMRARDVLGVLLSACESTGVEIVYNSWVSGIVREGDDFSVKAGERIDHSRFLVITAGGKSWPRTGSSGDGSTLASALGQPVVEQRPALVPLYPADYDCGGAAGTALNTVEIRLLRDGKVIARGEGDVLFTHTGLSGPGVLDISRYCLPGDILSINLVTGLRADEVSPEIQKRCAQAPKKTLKNILCGLGIPESLVVVVLGRAQARLPDLQARLPDKPVRLIETTGAELTKQARSTLAAIMTDFSFLIERTGSFEEAMATAGGVDTAYVDPKTMASRLVSGLYFAGETLDVDGDTGGFNIQFAFSSAFLAAQAIAKEIRKTSGTAY